MLTKAKKGGAFGVSEPQVLGAAAQSVQVSRQSFWPLDTEYALVQYEEYNIIYARRCIACVYVLPHKACDLYFCFRLWTFCTGKPGLLTWT